MSTMDNDLTYDGTIVNVSDCFVMVVIDSVALFLF